MKRLILDCFRRWSVALACCAVLQVVLGWSSFDRSDYFLSGILALYTGVFLLSIDLQRGVARTVAALPLSAKQIGRGWWLATVGIPSVALAALLFFGASVSCLFHHDKTFPAARLTLASIITLLWLGVGFFVINNMTPGWGGNLWERARKLFIGASFGLMVGGGFLFLQDLTKNDLKLAGFLGVGAIITALGWFRAEQFVLGRTSFRFAALESKKPRDQHRSSGGYGGVAFLFTHTFFRTFLMGLGMVAFLALFMGLQGEMKSWRQAVETIGGFGAFFPFWLIIFVQTLPNLLQLRFLRTLPIPPTHLAAIMIALVLLPLIALGALIAGVAALSLGPPIGLTVLKSYIWTTAPLALFVVFVVWQGLGGRAYGLFFFTIVGFQIVPLWLQFVFKYREIPFSLTGVIAAMCVTLAFLLTRRALLHSSNTYRVQANPFGAGAWGAGRG